MKSFIVIHTTTAYPATLDNLVVIDAFSTDTLSTARKHTTTQISRYYQEHGDGFVEVIENHRARYRCCVPA